MMAHSILPIHFNDLQEHLRKIPGDKGQGEQLYAQGFKRCQMCELFIKWGGAKCPCCKSALRTKPRGKKRIKPC